MKEQIEIRNVSTFIGNCPSCKEEQKSYKSENVDIRCVKCIIKDRENEFKNKYKHLIGSTVIDLYYKLGNNTLKLKTIGGKEFEFYFSNCK